MYNYAFSHLKNEGEKNQLLNVLKEKYFNEMTKEINFSNCYIQDKNNSVILVSNNIDLTIHYIINVYSDLFQQMKDLTTIDLEIEKQKTISNEQEVYKRL